MDEGPSFGLHSSLRIRELSMRLLFNGSFEYGGFMDYPRDSCTKLIQVVKS